MDPSAASGARRRAAASPPRPRRCRPTACWTRRSVAEPGAERCRSGRSGAEALRQRVPHRRSASSRRRRGRPAPARGCCRPSVSEPVLPGSCLTPTRRVAAVGSDAGDAALHASRRASRHRVDPVETLEQAGRRRCRPCRGQNAARRAESALELGGERRRPRRGWRSPPASVAIGAGSRRRCRPAIAASVGLLGRVGSRPPPRSSRLSTSPPSAVALASATPARSVAAEVAEVVVLPTAAAVERRRAAVPGSSASRSCSQPADRRAGAVSAPAAATLSYSRASPASTFARPPRPASTPASSSGPSPGLREAGVELTGAEGEGRRPGQHLGETGGQLLGRRGPAGRSGRRRGRRSGAALPFSPSASSAAPGAASSLRPAESCRGAVAELEQPGEQLGGAVVQLQDGVVELQPAPVRSTPFCAPAW